MWNVPYVLKGCFGCRVWGTEGLGDQLESYSRVVGTALLAALVGGGGVGQVRGPCGRWVGSLAGPGREVGFRATVGF